MIYGNKEGIRDSLLAQLETLYDLEIPAEVFAPAELLDVLAALHVQSTVKSACTFPEAARCWISRLAEQGVLS